MCKAKAIIGYGLAIFDKDLEYDRKNIKNSYIWNSIWKITGDSDFVKFANSINVSIKEWDSEEKQRWIWLVDKLTYCETTEFERMGQFIPVDKSRIEEVRFELFRILKEKTGWTVKTDIDCEWGLHLYYES